jgi:hypothetical protein
MEASFGHVCLRCFFAWNHTPSGPLGKYEILQLIKCSTPAVVVLTCYKTSYTLQASSFKKKCLHSISSADSSLRGYLIKRILARHSGCTGKIGKAKLLTPDYAELLCRVALVRTDDSEESSASIIRMTRIGELRTLAVTSNRRTLRKNMLVIMR